MDLLGHRQWAGCRTSGFAAWQIASYIPVTASGECERFQVKLFALLLMPISLPSESLFQRTADLLVSEGYADVGYKYLIIDDCWMESERDPFTGRVLANKERFPRGLNWLSDYVSVWNHWLPILCVLSADTQQRPQIWTVSRYREADLHMVWTRHRWFLRARCTDLCRVERGLRKGRRVLYTKYELGQGLSGIWTGPECNRASHGLLM